MESEGESVDLGLEDRFLIVEKVGQGTYSSVYKALDRWNGKIVALKKVNVFKENEGLPVSFYRETRILSKMDHENVVKYHGIHRSVDNELFFILDYCENDLSSLIFKNRAKLTVSNVKFLFFQLMCAIMYVHKHDVTHRDIKPSNILVNRKGKLKITDFGLANFLRTDGRPNTIKVASPRYRAPELLLGDTSYTKAIDMWSAGCVLYEMITGKPVFATNTGSDMSQLDSIFKICGTPADSSIFNTLPQWKLVQLIHRYPSALESHLKTHIPIEYSFAIPILHKLLVLEPENRATAEELYQDMSTYKYDLEDLSVHHIISTSHFPIIQELDSLGPLRADPPLILC